MIYMLKVDMLVAAIVFGFAGLFILGMFAWTKMMEYAQALRAINRIATARNREGFAISRVSSRNPNPESFHAA